jgi:hypothetical protein
LFVHSRHGGGAPARTFTLTAFALLLTIASLLAGLLAAGDAGAASARSPGATFISRAAGEIVPVPRAIPHQAGSMIDRRLIPNLRWLAKRYDFYVTEGYAGPLRGQGTVGCPECHVRGSDHHYGLAVDIVAADWSSRCSGGWRPITALARWAEPRQNVPVAPFRWVGYNGDSGHGCGHHLHLSWNHADGPSFRVADWVQLFRVKLQAAGDHPRPSRPRPPLGPSGGVSPSPLESGGVEAPH